MEFIHDNDKLMAVQGLSGASIVEAEKDSFERKLISSLCYDYGMRVAPIFVSDTVDKALETHLRRIAYNLLWSKLNNLHGCAREKIKTGKASKTLQAACFWFVSSAIVNWRRRNLHNRSAALARDNDD